MVRINAKRVLIKVELKGSGAQLEIPVRSRIPVASKVLTPGRVGWEGVEKVVDSKRMTPATERDADESKDS